jgi:hypothetical protein
MCVFIARVLTYLCGLKPANIPRVRRAKCEKRDLLNTVKHEAKKENLNN